MRLGVVAVLLVLGLAGCASDGVIIHRMPAETPAADNAAAVQKIAALAEAKKAAATRQQTGEELAPPLTPADAPAFTTYDPWERLNRFNYRFNARFDEA